ncbi:MAG: restriction endonuclease, partial [Synergistaceae bacterium]|nr:restriction endonuclease [Synergistaceae bacterium]
MSEQSELNFKPLSSEEESDYENLVSQILARVNELSSAGFEQLVTDLLIRMGYEVYKNAKRRLSPSAIQGIIIEDGPGYKPIYIQTRKLKIGSIITSWSMQTFGDAVSRKAGRGLLVTNAGFSKPAQDYAKEKKIILIDGGILARLMIVHNFCVNILEYFS